MVTWGNGREGSSGDIRSLHGNVALADILWGVVASADSKA